MSLALDLKLVALSSKGFGRRQPQSSKLQPQVVTWKIHSTLKPTVGRPFYLCLCWHVHETVYVKFTEHATTGAHKLHFFYLTSKQTNKQTNKQTQQYCKTHAGHMKPTKWNTVLIIKKKKKQKTKKCKTVEGKWWNILHVSTYDILYPLKQCMFFAICLRYSLELNRPNCWFHCIGLRGLSIA